MIVPFLPLPGCYLDARDYIASIVSLRFLAMYIAIVKLASEESQRLVYLSLEYKGLLLHAIQLPYYTPDPH